MRLGYSVPMPLPLLPLLATYPRPFWVMWLGTLVNRLGEFVVPLLGFYLAKERGLSVTEISVVMGTLGIGRFFAEGLGGLLIDRFGPRPAMQLSLAGGAALLLALAYAQTFPQLVAGALGYSLFSALYKPASTTAVAELTQGPQRTRAFNLLYWAINVGAAVAPVLGGYLAGFSYRLLFFLDAATMLVYSLLLSLFFPKVARPRHLGAAPKPRLLPRDSLLAWFCVASLLNSLTYSSYRLLALVFAVQGLSAAQYGGVLALNGALVVLLGLPIGHLISKTNRSEWQIWGSALLGLGFLTHASGSALWIHCLAVAIWSMGEIVGHSISKTVISELSPPEQRGQYVGLVGSMSGLAALLSPLLGGFFLEHYGAGVMWSVVAGLAFASAAVFWWIQTPIEQRRTNFAERTW